MSTVADRVGEPTLIGAVSHILQTSGIYILTLAVLVLLALEAYELYYLRRIVERAKHSISINF